MFLWLKESAEKKLDPKEWCIRTHRTGAKYVEVSGAVDEFIVGIPSIPQEFIERVTLKDTIYRGSRNEGVYRHNGATLVVKSSTYFSAFDQVACQDITVGAPTICALVAIYTLVRQGKLLPEENWEGRISSATPTQEPAGVVEKTSV